MKRTTIKSVVAQVALILDDRYWNDSIILENATRAYRQMNIVDKWEPKVVELDLVDHKATLPKDYKELIQIAYKHTTSADNATSPWYAMRLSSNTIFNYNCGSNCTCTTDNCSNCSGTCPHEYTVYNDTITSTLRNGTLLVSYFAYPIDTNGDHLIPDDETLKEAIFHYILYKYWLQKDLMKETGASERMQFHLQMWSVLSKKAQSLNLPSLGQLENIRANRSKLVSNPNAFDTFFATIGANQRTSF